jgi:hypothetical protein
MIYHKKLKIFIIGVGSGVSMVLSTLKNDTDVTAVVSIDLLHNY